MELLPSQIAHLEKLKSLLAQGAPGALLCTPCGSGKTVMSMHLGAKKSVLVVTSPSTLEDWRSVVARMGRKYCVVHGSVKDSMWLHHMDAEVLITTYCTVSMAEDFNFQGHGNVMETTLSFMCSRTWDFVFFDEAHEIRNEETQVSESVMALKSKFNLMITYTPVNNSVDDIVRLFEVARLVPEKGWDRSDSASFSENVNAYVKKYVIQEDPERVREEESRYRVTTVSISSSFLTEEESRLYNEAIERGDVGICGEQRKCASGVGLPPSVLPTRIHMLRLYLENVIVPRGDHGIVFCEYLETIRRAAVALRGVCAVFTACGELNTKKRIEVREKFEAVQGPAVLLTTNIFAQGVSFPNANHVVTLEPHYNPVRSQQANARVTRITSLKTPFWVTVKIEGTVDESVEKIAAEKTALQLAVMSGSYPPKQVTSPVTAQYTYSTHNVGCGLPPSQVLGTLVATPAPRAHKKVPSESRKRLDRHLKRVTQKRAVVSVSSMTVPSLKSRRRF